MNIKQLMKKHSSIMDIISTIYNILHLNNNWKHKRYNKIIYKGVFLNKVRLKIKGCNNTIIIGRKARLNNCIITIIGDNCKLIIGEGSTIISNTSFWCQDNNSSIIIDKDFTMEGGHIASTEGASINIGENCMFSEDIEIRNGDSHSIIDITKNERINYASSVNIGNNVWLTAHVRVLKGSAIPSNCIIGNSSVVSGILIYSNALYAGIPCKLIKENIIWDRYKI